MDDGQKKGEETGNMFFKKKESTAWGDTMKSNEKKKCRKMQRN